MEQRLALVEAGLEEVGASDASGGGSGGGNGTDVCSSTASKQ